MVTTAPNLLLTSPRRLSSYPMSLICFPYAGANPYIFFEWMSRMAPQVEVVGIQLPGRGMRLREPSYGSVAQIISEVVDAVTALEERPFAFYGHSLGALIAFEVAREMRRLRRPQPLHLFVGGARPPHLPAITPHLHDLDQDEFLESIQARYGGIPAIIRQESELMDLFLPPLRADFAAYETYVHESEVPLDFPISAFAGANDPLVTAEVMGEWRQHTSVGFDLTVLAGDHFFLGPNRDGLLENIRRALHIAP